MKIAQWTPDPLVRQELLDRINEYISEQKQIARAEHNYKTSISLFQIRFLRRETLSAVEK